MRNYLLTNLSCTLLVALMALSGAAVAQSPATASGETIEKGFTQPSLRKELAFSFQGIIAKVNVHAGDRIKAGQELMRQDDRIEIKRLEGLKLQADQSITVRAKEAIRENKKIVLKRKQEMFNNSAATEAELQEAQLDVVQASAEVDVVRYDAQTKEKDTELQAVHIELLSLRAPSDLDGIVEKIVQTEGEVANIDKPAIVVVRNDPLYIELKTLPTSTVQRLKTGDELDVRYPGEDKWRKAKINLIAPVAAAGSNTQAIRLEMPNPELRSTGLAIDVKIPTPSVADAR